ncbi:unnamed protein product [Gongylonema pulchrum]|uniref:FAD_binding_3 domain-containing protein n=1 Tax=Gongylonema pulchrum TaxID=637853 RepID=A0A183DVL7_9BILA|nr:unnamed protein product [Gongylonema pulchrum]
MRIVVIGAAPTGLGVAYRLHELQRSNNEHAQHVELIILEQVQFILLLHLLSIQVSNTVVDLIHSCTKCAAAF